MWSRTLSPCPSCKQEHIIVSAEESYPVLNHEYAFTCPVTADEAVSVNRDAWDEVSTPVRTAVPVRWLP